MTPGGWKFAAASVIGTSHNGSEGGRCQDAHACQYLEHSNLLFAVVADGAGSASCADQGSQFVCSLVSDEIDKADPGSAFTREFALHTLTLARARLEQQAAGIGMTPRDFACTLLVAIVGENMASFWQIGDGAICFRLQEEESFKYAFWPEKGEYANVTSFVTDSQAEAELLFDAADCNVSELGMFSDGIERLALDFTSGEVHSAFFRGLFPHFDGQAYGYSAHISEQMAAFLGSERVNKRTDDDKTLILATRASQE